MAAPSSTQSYLANGSETVEEPSILVRVLGAMNQERPSVPNKTSRSSVLGIKGQVLFRIRLSPSGCPYSPSAWNCLGRHYHDPLPSGFLNSGTTQKKTFRNKRFNREPELAFHKFKAISKLLNIAKIFL